MVNVGGCSVLLSPVPLLPLPSQGDTMGQRFHSTDNANCKAVKKFICSCPSFLSSPALLIGDFDWSWFQLQTQNSSGSQSKKQAGKPAVCPPGWCLIAHFGVWLLLLTMEATDLADYTHCPPRAAHREAAIYGISIIIPREGLLFL